MLGMMSCKEAGRLVSEARDHELSMRNRMGLRMHLAMCRVCKIYNRQIEMLGELSRRVNTFVLDASLPLALSTDAKVRIKARLSRNE